MPLSLKFDFLGCNIRTGNYGSRNMGGGSYIKITGLFFKQINYDRVFLEWAIICALQNCFHCFDFYEARGRI